MSLSRKVYIAVGYALSGWMAFTLQPGFGSMLEQWDTAKLTKESKGIRIGEVTSKWSSWDPARGMVYTYVKLNVSETLKGIHQKEVLLRIPGGETEGIRMVVHGMASFGLGEKALVFTGLDEEGAPYITGWTQGKFKIVSDRSSGQDMALFQAPSNVEFYTRAQKGQVKHVVATHVERRLPLKELIREIQTAVRMEVEVTR